MKKLLIFAAVIETLTGLILFVRPPILTWLLLDTDVVGTGVLISRLAGMALIALAVACWPDGNTLRAFLGMLTYGLLAMLYLVYLGVHGLVGILLWPAVVVHGGLSLLLVRAWWNQRRAPELTLVKNSLGSESVPGALPKGGRS